MLSCSVQGKGRHSFPSGHYDEAAWDQGLRHGPATYFHPNGNKETKQATFVLFFITI
jgi:hypothetical protein